MARSKEEIEELATVTAARFMDHLSAATAAGRIVRDGSNTAIVEELLVGWSDEERIIFHSRYSDEIERRIESGELDPVQPAGYLYLLAAKPGSKIDRVAVREYVRRDSEAILECVKNGLNFHQLALDQKDIVENYANSLPADEANDLLRIYSEEVNASTKHLDLVLEKTPDIYGSKNKSLGKAGGVFVFICIIIVVLAILKK